MSSDKETKMITTLFDELREIMSCLGKLLKNPHNIELFKSLYAKNSPVDSLSGEDMINFLTIAKTFTSGKDFLKGTPFELIAKNVPAMIDILIKNNQGGPKIKEIATVYDE